MGVEVDRGRDTGGPSLFQCFPEAGPGAQSQLVPTPQDDGESSQRQNQTYQPGKGSLRQRQILVGAVDVAQVPKLGVFGEVYGKVAEAPTNLVGPQAGAFAPLIEQDPLIDRKANEAENRVRGIQTVGDTLDHINTADDLVPAHGLTVMVVIKATGPEIGSGGAVVRAKPGGEGLRAHPSHVTPLLPNRIALGASEIRGGGMEGLGGQSMRVFLRAARSSEHLTVVGRQRPDRPIPAFSPDHSGFCGVA